MAITLQSVKMLWGRAAGLCSMPECRKPLVLDETDSDPEALIGDMCHIVAEREDCPRGCSPLTKPQRDHYSNLILLCRNHHGEIDGQPEAWPVERLNSATKPSSAKLSDPALVLLSHAANRDDRMLLPAPDEIKARGAALQRVLTNLLKQELIEETAVNASERAWRSEEDAGRIGLRITDAGLTAIGVPALADWSEAETNPPAEDRAAAQSLETDAKPSRRSGGASASANPAAVKPESKQALLVTQLSRSAGATIAHLVGVLGWQPHTIRAALTGLRQRGYDVAREKNRKGETVYRATLPAPTGRDAVGSSGRA